MDCIDIFISLANSKEVKKRWATDLTWSKNTNRSDLIVQEPDNRVLYYLQDGPDRAFVREELVHISEDTQVLPDWVSEWKYAHLIL